MSGWRLMLQRSQEQQFPPQSEERPWTSTTLMDRCREEITLLQSEMINTLDHFTRMTPRYLKEMFSVRPGASVYDLRTSQDDIAIPRARTDYYRKSFAITVAKIWNALPKH